MGAISDSKKYEESRDESPYVSEGILYYLNDQRHRSKGELTPEQKDLEKAAIRKRSQFRTPPLSLNNQDEYDQGPHLSHQPSQWSLGFLSQKDREEHFDLGYRFTLHSLLDPDAGFLKNS